MRSASKRSLLITGLVLVVLPVPGVAAAAPCAGSADIHDKGGEAAATCTTTDGDPAQPVGTGRDATGGGVACTPERAADPNAWTVSFVPPQHATETYRDLNQQKWRDAPEGFSLAVYVDCNGEYRSDLLWIPSPDPGSADDAEGIFVARAEARARVEPTVPVSAVSPEQAVVQFATWLWVDEAYWHPASATASTPAGIAVSVEARPVEATWDLDEGVRVCDGPGMAWSEAAQADYELQPESMRGAGNPACTFTFTDASSVRPSGVFDASVTVRWEFSWSLNGVDQGGFGSVEVSDSWELTVGEVQAVITG